MDNQHNTTRARRRRNTARKLPDTTVPSPCIGLCWLNDATQLCDGCFRNVDEIRDWMIMDKNEKLTVLASIEKRRIDATDI
ncbi:MAG: Unknown protein [uncultured Thiotrichaceae bacterium]|uniref:DUF1289 domain-containing protein n=1 Tax=uncultured Thiotrichaceae bacterium TaxID=298394 RepID=A0A6S6UEN0_9GAMM|nr:MAG: Unknown protein [uncultured Thiotrichaceae bacterium]